LLDVIGFKDLNEILKESDWSCDVSLNDIMNGVIEINDKQIICFGAAFEFKKEEFFILFEFNLDYYTLKLRMYANEDFELAKSCLAMAHSVFQNL
jgi:hypothetical protein